MSKKLSSTSKKPKKTVKKVAAKTGRKPLDVDDLMVKICFDAPKGLNDKQLHTFLGISETKYFELKAGNKAFTESIKFYRKVSAVEVMQSFKKIAVGFDFDEVKKELRKDKATGEYKLVTTEVVTKHIAPNATAGIFFLKNQMPDQFKDKIEQVHSFTGDMENITFVIKSRD